MAADTTRLQGEIIVDPEKQALDVEKLLLGFLRSMIEEQNLTEVGHEVSHKGAV